MSVGVDEMDVDARGAALAQLKAQLAVTVAQKRLRSRARTLLRRAVRLSSAARIGDAVRAGRSLGRWRLFRRRLAKRGGAADSYTNLTLPTNREV